MLRAMATINENYGKLQAGYLFPEIARRVGAFSAANPDAKIIRLGIGDVTLPLAPAIVEALRAAADEMGRETGVHGYGPENGYDFLLEAICEHDYRARGIDIATNEVFVSDGSKQDSGNIQEIFDTDSSIAVTDPSYPVYVDTNVMAGRTGNANPDGTYEGILYLPATEANDFAPPPPEESVDLVYLCSPNNPTGAVASRENLTAWVRWARQNDSVLIFDAAYDAFIQDDDLPHSIYEIDGATRVRDRDAQLLEARGLHGRALCVHGGAAATGGHHLEGRARLPRGSLVAAPGHEIQQRPVPGAARGGGRLFARGPQADRRAGRLLHAQRGAAAGRSADGGVRSLRRRARPLRVDEDARWHVVVGLLRRTALQGPCRRNPGLWFWCLWRGLHSNLGLQLSRKRRRSARAHSARPSAPNSTRQEKRR